MNHLFSNCESLLSLPDISKWNTNKVNDIIYIFDCCKFFISLPDLSEWNTSEITNLSHLFSN